MLKRFGTLYDLLVNLLNEKMSSGRAKKRTERNDKPNSNAVGFI